jgi:glycosyltransferase involved in cell wall biosynthesis
MKIAHLTASTFFGGPSRQMLGLAEHLPPGWETLFVSFSEGSRCREFLTEVRRLGFEAVELEHDTPRLRGAAQELTAVLGEAGIDAVLCHGYKANLLGRVAARRLGIPAVAVARGWTGESWRVRCYEALDRWHLRWMDHVVGVSDAQAAKVARAGVAAERLSVIHNAIDGGRFDGDRAAARRRLNALFASPPRLLVGAAGRLSPEKGFTILVEAAAVVGRKEPAAAFVIVGDGPLRAALENEARRRGLDGKVVFTGYRRDLDALMPGFDLFTLPSFTEGLPNVVLEACAASVPVVATAVGGTPEIVEDGVNGLLVPPGDGLALAGALLRLLGDGQLRVDLAERGRARVEDRFTFAAQAEAYRRLLASLVRSARREEVVPC